MDFNDSKETYRKTIEKSIRFTGKEHEFFIRVKADLFSSFFPGSTVKLLDIGCGHGYLHPMLDPKKFEIVGVDVAEEVIALAKQERPHMNYFSYDGKTLPFEDQSFDAAVAICVMHHVEPGGWERFLSEMKRILKRDGVGLIFEHNPLNPLTRYVVAHNPIDFDAVLLSKTKLERVARSAGFRSIKTRYFLFTPFASAPFRWLDRKLGWCPLGAQYCTQLR